MPVARCNDHHPDRVRIIVVLCEIILDALNNSTGFFFVDRGLIQFNGIVLRGGAKISYNPRVWVHKLNVRSG